MVHAIRPSWQQWGRSVFDQYRPGKDIETFVTSSQTWLNAFRSHLSHPVIVDLVRKHDADRTGLLLEKAGFKRAQFSRWSTEQQRADPRTFFALVYLGFKTSIAEIPIELKTPYETVVAYASRQTIGDIHRALVKHFGPSTENPATVKSPRAPSWVEWVFLSYFFQMQASEKLLIDGWAYWEHEDEEQRTAYDGLMTTLVERSASQERLKAELVAISFSPTEIAASLRKWSAAFVIFKLSGLIS